MSFDISAFMDHNWTVSCAAYDQFSAKNLQLGHFMNMNQNSQWFELNRI